MREVFVLSLFFTYFLAGLAIAMPVGVMTIEMTKQGLPNGFMRGWAVGLGGMTIDVLLIIALYMGLASVLSIPFIQIPMWLLGAGFLAFLGYDSIKNANQGLEIYRPDGGIIGVPGLFLPIFLPSGTIILTPLAV